MNYYEELGKINKKIERLQRCKANCGSVGVNMEYLPSVDTPLYGGTEIWLFKNNDGTVQSTGFGKFYNPKYDQSVAGFRIWDAGNTYTAGDKAIWGGREWTNLDGNVGASVDIFTLDSEWEVIPYNDTDYNVVYDPIEYDAANDFIVSRKEVVANNEVSCSYEIGLLLQYDYSFLTNNPIKVFQWGNYLTNTLIVGNGSNYCNNSFLENINLRGNRFVNNICNNLSGIYQLTADNNSSISQLTANNSSIIFQLTANNKSSISQLTANNDGSISRLTANDNSSISQLTADASVISQLTANNLSGIYQLTADNGSDISRLTANDNCQVSLFSVSSPLQILNFNNILITSNQNGLIATAQSIELSFTLSFDGTAGKGQIGAIDMPNYVIPTGFICSQTLYNVITPLVSTLGELTIGYATDQVNACLDNTVALINATPISNLIFSSAFTPTTDTRSLVGEVTAEDITAGSIYVKLTFTKVI